MLLEIRNCGIEIDRSARESIERRFRFTLGRYAPRVERVTVYLTDFNGPRGGRDKRCRVVVAVPPGSVTAQVTDSVLGAAVDRAADRVGRAVGRDLERRRHRRDAVSASGQGDLSRCEPLLAILPGLPVGNGTVGFGPVPGTRDDLRG